MATLASALRVTLLRRAAETADTAAAPADTAAAPPVEDVAGRGADEAGGEASGEASGAVGNHGRLGPAMAKAAMGGRAEQFGAEWL